MKGGDADVRSHGRRVIGDADMLHARLREYQSRVERALEVIAEARRIGGIAVSFSGGKDSTVLLHLVRRVDPDAPALFFDSGAELWSTREMVRTHGAITIAPMMSVIDAWKLKGYGGSKPQIAVNLKLNLQEILIDEPARRGLMQTGCDVSAIGLRMDESRGRKMSGLTQGELHRYADGTAWRLCPLMRWSARDVWAYIASNGVAYNGAYDRMTALGIPRDQQRISTLLDGNGINMGRYVYLKHIDPEVFNLISAEFPRLKAYA